MFLSFASRKNSLNSLGNSSKYSDSLVTIKSFSKSPILESGNLPILLPNDILLEKLE